MGGMGKEGWAELLLIPGPTLQCQARPITPARIDAGVSRNGGAGAWCCVFLSRHCSLLKVEFRLVVTSWTGCPTADKAPFVTSVTKGKGKLGF